MPLSHRIIFQPANGVGLGHVNRLIAIAIELRRLEANSKILFALTGEGSKLVEAFDFAFLTIPKYSSRVKGWTKLEFEQFSREFCFSFINSTRPDLLMFDCFPDRFMVQAAHEGNVRMALCVRETKEMKSYYEMNKSILPDIDLLIFPHSEHEIFVPDEYKAKSLFVGNIVRLSDTRERIVIKSEGSKFVVISGGGGGYPGTVDFYNLALKAFAIVKEQEPRLSGLLVAGPLFREWDRLEPSSSVRIVPFAPNLQAIFRVADVVICQAGYNTVAEISWLRVPTICVPAPRQVDDQYTRAEALAAAHTNISTVTKRDPAILAAALNSTLKLTGDSVAMNQPPSGAVEAAKALLDLVEAGDQ